jgi:hypothetical protein
MARRGHRPSTGTANRPKFWGRHPVTAALANPNRTVRKIWGTREALSSLDLPPAMPVVYADAADLGRLVPSRRAAPGPRRRGRAARGDVAGRPARCRARTTTAR